MQLSTHWLAIFHVACVVVVAFQKTDTKDRRLLVIKRTELSSVNVCLAWNFHRTCMIANVGKVFYYFIGLLELYLPSNAYSPLMPFNPQH